MTRQAPPSLPHYQGAIVAHAPGGALIGWAMNLSHPEQSLWIEILGDGDTMELVCANVILNSPPGDVPPHAHGHGFIAHIGPARQQGIGRLDARIANTDHHLAGGIITQSPASQDTHAMAGHVENRGGLKCWGWAQDSTQPDQTVKVLFYQNGQWLGDTQANRYQYDYEEHTAGHGFEFSLPDTLADGQRHRIDVVTEANETLIGSPLTVFIPQEGHANWLASQAPSDDVRPLFEYIGQQHAFYRTLSLHFRSYEAWFTRYGQRHSPTSGTAPFLIAVYGEGDGNATLHSLEAQHHPHWRAIRLQPGQLPSESATWRNALEDHYSRQYSLVMALRAGDTLEPHALALMAAALVDDTVQLVYSDSDILQAGDTRLPWFKPDWDPDLALHQPLLNGFATRSTRIPLEDAAPCPDAWAWHALEGLTATPASVHHLPQVLLHQARPVEPEAFTPYRDAWLTAHAPGVRIEQTDGKTHIHWPEPTKWPSVSLIIPTRDKLELLKPCLESLKATDYPNLELIVVDNDSTDPATLRYLKRLGQQGIRCLPHHGPFNFASLNNRAVHEAHGELIGLINNDIEALDTIWLKEMVTTLLRPDVAAVGAKLLWPNGMVQHGGVVLGLHGLAGHIGNQWHAQDDGYFGLNQSLRTASAVTAACLLCRRHDYLATGGLDEHRFAVNFNDVDFCLRLSQSTGRRIVWTPHAILQHAESASRGRDELPSRRARLFREHKGLLDLWEDRIMDDPWYNPNLNLDHYSHAGPALPPRTRRQPRKPDNSTTH